MPSVWVLPPSQRQRGYIFLLPFSFDIWYSLDFVSSPVPLMWHFSASVVLSYFNISFLGSYFISTHCSIQLLQYSFLTIIQPPSKWTAFADEFQWSIMNLCCSPFNTLIVLQFKIHFPLKISAHLFQLPAKKYFINPHLFLITYSCVGCSSPS